MSSDVVGLWAGEEDDCIGHLFWFAEAAHRNCLDEGVQVLLVYLGQQRRVGRSGADTIHGDIIARTFAREALRETDQARLGPGIDGLPEAAELGQRRWRY